MVLAHPSSRSPQEHRRASLRRTNVATVIPDSPFSKRRIEPWCIAVVFASHSKLTGPPPGVLADMRALCRFFPSCKLTFRSSDILSRYSFSFCGLAIIRYFRIIQQNRICIYANNRCIYVNAVAEWLRFQGNASWLGSVNVSLITKAVFLWKAFPRLSRQAAAGNSLLVTF